jgi:gliding motility-associated-like protein
VRVLFATFICIVVCCSRVCAQASFLIPDTICLSEPVVINNNSTGGSSFYWNFCSANLFQPPNAVNLGTLNNTLNVPAFCETVKEGTNYYAFIINNMGTMVKLSFGNNLLNNPTIKNMGNAGGVIPYKAEGLQIVQDADGWHIIIVGGVVGSASPPKIVKLDFGASISNDNPVGTDWGNIGGLGFPTDLYMFQEGGRWYGFTTNSEDNTITRFDFGTNFRNPPTGVNLGNIGNLNYPTGMYAAKLQNNWVLFVTNTFSNTITRLDFGNSLLNTPVPTNLGNPGGLLNAPRDIYIINDCGATFGVVANGTGNNLIRLAFQGASVSSAASYGNVGDLLYPHGMSSVFREGDNLYTFVTNASGNTLTRVVFSSCTNASVASSRRKNPPAFYYHEPGTYTINLVMNEGLPDQQTYCRNLVVKPSPVLRPVIEDEYCSRKDGKITLNVLGGSSPFAYYINNTLVTGAKHEGLANGPYMVKVVDSTGCFTKDTTVTLVNLFPAPVKILNNDTTINIGEPIILTAANAPDYKWISGSGLDCDTCRTTLARPVENTIYGVQTLTGKNCKTTDSVTVTVTHDLSFFIPNAFSPDNNGLNDVFRVKAKGVAGFSLNIYNRVGKLLFTTTDPKQGWDGRYGIDLQPMGTYIYLLRYFYYGEENKWREKRGTITLIR